MREEPSEEPMQESDADEAASVFDFVNDFLDDRSAGRLLGVVEYQKRFPGAESAIALEFERLTQPDEDESHTVRSIQHYKLIRELGRGGQGSVWLAEDQNLRRPVALKLLNSWLIAGERLARFQREAESIARLEHEGLAVVYEAQMENEPPFIAMRYVEGDDLSTCLANRTSKSAPFLPIVSSSKLRRTLHFFERAARALHVAHEAGVVHRDIKPGNILITSAGHPVITDFGLARDEFSPGEETITQEGEVFGTPAYMSPEQVGGRSEDVDRRTDVWSLGATLYETLCGQAPFQGKGQIGLARAILEARLPTPRALPGEPSLPTDVQVVLQTALERDLDRRYPSALAMAEDLRRIREFEPIQARPASPWLKLRRWARREPAWATALCLLLITLVGGLVASRLTIDRIQGLLHDKEVALNQERALRYVRQVPHLLKNSPSLALAVGLEAVDMHDSWITRSSLYGPLENLTLHAQGELAASNLAWSAAFLGDGSRAVVTSRSGGVTLVKSSDGSAIASRIIEGVGEGPAPEIRHVLEIQGQDAVIICTGDGRVLRLSLPDLETTWEARLSQTRVLSMALFPDAMHLVALTGDEGLAKLRVADGTLQMTIPVPSGSASLVMVLPHAKQVLTSGMAIRGDARNPTPRATLWDVETGASVREFVHASAVRCATIDASGSFLATGTLRGNTYLWDLNDALSPPLIRAAEGALDCIGFSPDGSRLAAGGESGAWVWNGLESAFQPLLGHRNKVVDLEFCPTGDTLATCSWDSVVRIFPAAGGPLILENLAGDRPLLVTWSKSGDQLLSAGIGFRFSFWNASTPARARRLPGLGSPLTWAGFTHLGDRALALDEEGRLLLFATPLEVQLGEAAPSPVILADHGPGPAFCAIAAHAPRAVSGGTHGEVWLHGLDQDSAASVNRGWVQGIRHLAISPDGKQVAIVDGIGRLGLWDGGEGPALRPTGADQQIQRVCFDSSGRYLAAGDALGQVLIWDTSSGELLHRLTSEWNATSQDRHPVIDLEFAPDGRSIHAACAPWSVLSWDLSTSDEKLDRETRMALRWLKVLPEQMGVLTCGTGVGTFSIGSSDRLSRPATLHEAPLTCMDVNGPARLAATGCQDGTILVWNVVSGETLARYDQHQGPVRHVAFARLPGDDRVLSVSDDGTLALWCVDPTPVARRVTPHGLNNRHRERFDSWGMAAESK